MGVAQKIYAYFLQEVVVAKVFGDAERERGGGRLDASQHAEIAQGKRMETRPPFLTRRSGKGGWSADPDRASAYARFINVSLLDHLCSVLRGAVQLGEIDLLAAPDKPNGDELSQRLATIAAIAFLHDADKILQLPRSEHLEPAQIADLMARYGLDDFLERHAKPLSGAQMLALIEQVEATRAGRLQAVPRAALHDCTYVRLADRLDSRFLQIQPDPGRPSGKIGLDAVLDELKRYDALDTDTVRHWRPIQLRDPHTPFLLDALQACLSEACRTRHGHPPLIEMHHDGRLLVLIPEDGADAVIEEALAEVTGQLGATIRIHVTDRGTIDLLDAPGALADLRRSVEGMLATDREEILRIGRDVVGAHRADIDTLLGQVGFLPVFPDLDRFSKRLVPLWSGSARLDDAVRATHSDAALVNAVLSCEDPPAKLGIPNAAQREMELRHLLDDFGLLPTSQAWLSDIPNASRYALLAALAAGAAAERPNVADALIGSDGLVALWLEGRDNRKGLVAKIESSGTRLAEAVAVHYRTLLSYRLVRAADEAAEGRCHFTNAPVPRTARIDGSTGLYGLKVSAFSGREGRPESHRSTQSETLVSPLAKAEHRLRTIEYERSGRSPGRRDVPVRVTSPTAAGLFGALAYLKGNDPREYAFADVLRTRIDEGITYRSQDGLDRRVRIARYEEMPTRLVANGTEPGQISFVRIAFEAAQRLGRPIHVFRGLPRPQPEFVFFDTLPQPIELLLGSTGARLEQLPGMVERLYGVEAIANATGFGAELATRLCDPTTRFGAACDALARAETRLKKNQVDPILRRIQTFSLKLLGDPNTMPSISDRAIVAFGEAMALVQRIPLRSDGGNVTELGLRIALDTAEVLERLGQIHDDSLTAGVAGEITELLSRRSLVARGEIRDGRPLAEAVEAAAQQFVAGVWHGAFGGAVPSSRTRRVALATYRFSFERAARARWAALGQLHASDEAVY